jgi:carbon-monoxide dehydrogenase medium subunit
MRAFAYERPDRLADALALMAVGDGSARPLAGGTDLLIRIRAGSIRPSSRATSGSTTAGCGSALGRR